MKQAAAAAAAAQQALLLQQQSQPPLFPVHHPHPGLLAAPQIEPIVSGNLPPGFDSSTCRSVYVCNIHLQVTDAVLQEVFQSIGPVEGCKLIRKEKSSFGFIDYHDRRYAALAILSLNGRQLYGQPIKVNWAYTSTPREGTSGHFNIFVGDLCPEVTDATLFAFFSGYSTCSDASVMWDQKTGRSRGFGFVSFRNQQSSFGFIDYHDRRYAALAILSLNGRQLYGQPIKVNWAYTSTPREGTSGHFNIFVGDLCPEVTDATLFAFFSGYSTCSDASVMWDQKTGRSRGFGFVSFRNQQNLEKRIQMMMVLKITLSLLLFMLAIFLTSFTDRCMRGGLDGS
ncbi:oligouridylate-binding protein 1C isoform X3 [Zea mays]|uniref:oligouridylate-binding protein 1C isoform X3 n=1 Tax=Zea mays TaxID=4577 RepID=UPI0016527A9C|nr:oligouridylate-binding protein 1C isoform X3 [Zea mays]